MLQAENVFMVYEVHLQSSLRVQAYSPDERHMQQDDLLTKLSGSQLRYPGTLQQWMSLCKLN